jgi:hypothetical protein
MAKHLSVGIGVGGTWRINTYPGQAGAASRAVANR